MKLSEAFPSKWLKCSDLNGKGVKVKIASVGLEELQGDNGKEQKLVAHFSGTEKGFVLNQTNANAIGEIHGDDTDMWIGKVVELYPARVPFGPKIVDAIRVRMPTQTLPVRPSPAPVLREMPIESPMSEEG